MEVLIFAGLALLLALYFAPSLLAYARGAPDAGCVLAINILAGWTAIGWVIAFVMAFRDRPYRSHVQVINTVTTPPSWHAPVMQGWADMPGRPGEAPPLPPSRGA
jgi:Superinfection immunity protein